MNNVLVKLKGKLIVSCQAEGFSPFNTPEGVAIFALTAQGSGAGGIRSEGIAKTEKIKSIIQIPVIGMIKNFYPDGMVRITRTFEELESLIGIGVDIIAIDGTFRNAGGINGPDFIRMCKEKYPEICIIADIAQTNEALAYIEKGADAISTTLHGYTPETAHEPAYEPNFQFIQDLCDRIKGVPVITEGKINTPDEKMTIGSEQVKMLMDFVSLAKAHNIRLILVRPPEYITRYTYPMDFIRSICDRNGAEVYDFTNDSILTNTRDLYFDFVHLNHEGAELISNRLVDLIKMK